MNREERVIFAGTETDKTAQMLPASMVYRCKLSSSKRCQQAQWCHDKALLIRSILRIPPEQRAAHALQGNGLLTPEQALNVRMDRATAFFSHGRRVSPSHNSQSPRQNCPASAASRIGSWILILLPGRLHLRWLELLQTPSRLRCWLLRSCVIPFLASCQKNNTKP
jgi:hypothetical protein